MEIVVEELEEVCPKHPCERMFVCLLTYSDAVV